MNIRQLWQAELTAAAQVLQDLQQDAQLLNDFEHWVELCEQALGAGKKLLFIGNGGSAADAQHLAAELVVRFKLNRRGLPALALTVDSSALTAIGNDFGFDQLFSRQVEALGQPGDVLIALTTSGNSENVVKAVPVAQSMGIRVVAMTGASGGKIADMADMCLRMPSDDTPRIQEAHTLLGHMLCDLLEKRMFTSEKA
ncbi:MAG: D-sedoheptulose 7-phosphate isomerase [Gammaproteobacteria bacterium]|nr:D-sedoheptulose 7-phosphate isomerase [Gammaproteobacteria bacterium]